MVRYYHDSVHHRGSGDTPQKEGDTIMSYFVKL